jgi:drug/metabolite transporter (DMT)-like permease
MLGLLALSWITRHVPDMANAVAGGDLDRFRTLCRRDLILSCFAFLGGAAVLCIVHELAPSHYTDRVLPFWTFAGLLLSGFLGHIQTSLATQLRSFRREPLVWILLAGSTLTAAGAAWGSVHYSSVGVVAAMLSVQLLLTTPASVFIYHRSIGSWRARLACGSRIE